MRHGVPRPRRGPAARHGLTFEIDWTLGGEPFLDLAPGGSSVLLGYANGYAGYLPTRAAFAEATAHPDHPTYEVLISRVAPGQPERALAVAQGG